MFNLIRRAASLAAFAATITVLPALAASPAPAVPKLDTQMDVGVVVDGSLPGFKADELVAFVSQEMNAAHAAAWHFVATADAESTPNRVVWRFRLLPFAGGSVRYIGPAVARAESLFGVRRPVGLDARVYLDGRYQSTTFDQVSIKGGMRDSDLATAIQRVTRSVLADAVAERHWLAAGLRTPG